MRPGRTEQLLEKSGCYCLAVLFFISRVERFIGESGALLCIFRSVVPCLNPCSCRPNAAYAIRRPHRSVFKALLVAINVISSGIRKHVFSVFILESLPSGRVA